MSASHRASLTDISPPPELHQAVLDALPLAVFLVDQDMRLQGLNHAAEQWLEEGRDQILKRKSGDVMQCLNAASSAAGCGSSAACARCVIREAVHGAHGGAATRRKLLRFERIDPKGKQELMLAISAAPFTLGGRRLVLLSLEDMTELELLRGLLPRCAWCGQIRDSDDYWQSVEEYFQAHHDLEFSHTICEGCAAKHFTPERLRRPD